MISTINYKNFDNDVTSRLVTQIGELWIALARNPYGSHNLVLIKVIDGVYTAIRHGNIATLAWVVSEPVKDSKVKKAIKRCFQAIGVNPLANKPESRLSQLVVTNREKYLAKLEALRNAEVGRE